MMNGVWSTGMMYGVPVNREYGSIIIPAMVQLRMAVSPSKNSRVTNRVWFRMRTAVEITLLSIITYYN